MAAAVLAALRGRRGPADADRAAGRAAGAGRGGPGDERRGRDRRRHGPARATRSWRAAAGFEATGPFDLGDGDGLPAFDLDGEAQAAGFGLDTDVISTGDDAFVVFFGENYRVGAERVAEAEAALAGAAGGGGGFGLDVAGWFRDPAYAGSEEVGGSRHREGSRGSSTRRRPRPT